MSLSQQGFRQGERARWPRVLAAALLCAALPLPAFALGGGTKEKLKGGGYVILMRYTGKGLGDPANFDIANCKTQRNPNDTGRSDTKLVGERFQKAGIKITKALSSRWCRALDTAKLVAPAVTVEPRDELAAYLNRKDAAERRAIVAKVRAEIAAWRGPGNLLIVSHKQTLKAISGHSLPPGGYFVVDPKTMRIIAEDY